MIVNFIFWTINLFKSKQTIMDIFYSVLCDFNPITQPIVSFRIAMILDI